MEWKKATYPCYSVAVVWEKEEEKQRKELLMKFIEYFDFDRQAYCGQLGSYERFLNGKRSYNNTKLNYSHDRDSEEVPDHDHIRAFKKVGTKNIVVVNQPYQFERIELDKWCKERNLRYVICDKSHSFYYPGHSEMILIMSQDTYNHYQSTKEDFPGVWENTRKEKER